MHAFYMAVACFIGLMLPLQIGLNTLIARQVGSSLWAALMSFLVGGVALLIYFTASRQTWPTLQTVAAIPPYAWAAGLLGAFYVTMTIVVAPKIGAAMMVALAIGGQMAAAMLFDHYGWLGFPQHSISWMRVLGAVMVVTGVILIRKF